MRWKCNKSGRKQFARRVEYLPIFLWNVSNELWEKSFTRKPRWSLRSSSSRRSNTSAVDYLRKHWLNRVPKLRRQILRAVPADNDALQLMIYFSWIRVQKSYLFWNLRRVLASGCIPAWRISRILRAIWQKDASKFGTQSAGRDLFSGSLTITAHTHIFPFIIFNKKSGC